MIRCGLAAVETKEIEALRARRRLDRVFSPREIRDSRGRLVTLAGKLAAKRAVARALGGRTNLSHLEIVREATGKPAAVAVGNPPALIRDGIHLSLSISHTDTLAVAFCLVYDTAGFPSGPLAVSGGRGGRR